MVSLLDILAASLRAVTTGSSLIQIPVGVRGLLSGCPFDPQGNLGSEKSRNVFDAMYKTDNKDLLYTLR